MTPVTLCVTTFNRRDLLGRCLSSAFAGTVRPSRVVLVDQADAKFELMPITDATIPAGVPITLIDLGPKRGCESSAINHYLQHVPEERVIAHEDVAFGPTSLEIFVATAGQFLIDEAQGVITYRDEAVRLAGLYDTEMSPNHFRYVDADYEERLAELGIEPTVVACGIDHLPGGTIRGFSEAQMRDHLHRFGIADANYTKKWGRPLTPGASTIGRSHWRRDHWPAEKFGSRMVVTA